MKPHKLRGRTIREEFFVQREGSFQSPAAEVVCNYADHYRANTRASHVWYRSFFVKV